MGGQLGKERLTFLKGWLFDLKYVIKIRVKGLKLKNVFFFVFDPNFSHPGLADRFKAIVSCYYIAKINNYEFKIVHPFPYKLSDFVVENSVKWESSASYLEYSIVGTKFFVYTGLIKGLKCHLIPDKQYHCYSYKGDDIFYVNGVKNFGKEFGRLFNELFLPSPKLKAAIDSTGLKPKEYIAIHARFVNTLDSFESSKYPKLSPKKQTELLERCKNKLEEVINKEKPFPVVVFSDSKRFLDYIKNLNVVLLDSKNVEHISYSTNDDAILKTYLDFFLISRARTVYRMISQELYATNFSLYASYVGNAEEIELEV